MSLKPYIIIQGIILTIIIVLGLYFMPAKAKADQTQYSDYCLTADLGELANIYCRVGTQKFNTTSSPPQLPLVGELTTLTLKIANDGDTRNIASGEMQIRKFGAFNVCNNLNTPEIVGDGLWHDILFEFEAGDEDCEFDFLAGDKIDYIRGNSSDLRFAWTDNNIYTDTTYNYQSNGDSSPNHSLWFKINSFSVDSITWQSPQFDDGFISPDFAQWWVCANLYVGGAGPAYGYIVRIYSGNSTSTMTTIDDSFEQFGPFPVSALPLNECPAINKSATNTPDTYYAYATLSRYSSLSGETPIATSSIISFEITPGDSVLSPGTPNYNNFSPIRQALGDRFPFVYYYDLVDIVDDMKDNQASVASASVVTLRVKIGNATATAEVFSDTLLHKYLTSSQLNTLKTIIGWAMWISLFSYFLFRIKSLWHGNQGEQ